MVNNLLWSVLLFFVQPIFLVGLIAAVGSNRKRVQGMRKHFRVNFVRENYEMKDFFLKGIIPGILLSLFTVIIGIPFTIEWYIIYQFVAILFLLVGGYRLIHPLFTFSFTSIVLFISNRFAIEQPLSLFQSLFHESVYRFEGVNGFQTNVITNSLLLAALILLVSLYLLNKKEAYKMFPMLRSSKRGKTVAKYQNKSLWLLPLMVVVPGEVFEGFADWWPLLSINGNSYAFLFMPVLVGFHFTVSTQLLGEASSQIQKEFRYVAIAGLLLFGASYFMPVLSIFSAILLFGLGITVLFRHRRRENRWGFRYGPTNEGLRIIAVRGDSPAERMELSVGDIILEINDYDMMDIEDYHKVLAYNRSYIKMRVRRADGELIIVQTPLYEDDYNNLGLLILDN